jgi:hypothetical protein
MHRRGKDNDSSRLGALSFSDCSQIVQEQVIDNAILFFLDGRSSKKLKFEKAAKLRDRIKHAPAR